MSAEGEENVEDTMRRGVVGAEAARWWCCGNIMLGTRDCGGNGIFGEELEDFRDDLSGLPFESKTEVEDVLETEERGDLAAAVAVSAAAITVADRGDNGCSFLASVCVGEGKGEDLGNGMGWPSNED